MHCVGLTALEEDVKDLLSAIVEQRHSSICAKVVVEFVTLMVVSLDGVMVVVDGSGLKSPSVFRENCLRHGDTEDVTRDDL